MTKNLSEQICKICGIEPKRDYELTIDNTIEDIKFNKHKVCYGYPDFSEPTNFCKLINLIYKCGINQPYDYQLATLSADEDFYVETEQYENFQDRYLEVLIYLLSRDKDNWDKEFSKKIKQLIRKEKWKYE